MNDELKELLKEGGVYFSEHMPMSHITVFMYTYSDSTMPLVMLLLMQ